GQYDFTYAGLAQNASEWQAVDNCAPTPAHTTDAYGSTDTYSCAAGTTLLARVVNNTSHNWPSGAQGEDQRNRMWAFAMANPRPAAEAPAPGGGRSTAAGGRRGLGGRARR